VAGPLLDKGARAMKKTGWMKKLTVKELQHIKETSGAVTMCNAIDNAKFQESNRFPCWECVSIGRKLGVEIELKAFHARVAGGSNG